MTDHSTSETPRKKPSKKKLHLKIERAAGEISIVCSTLIGIARSQDLDHPDDLSHSAEFIGREIKRRAIKIADIADYLHGLDLEKESGRAP